MPWCSFLRGSGVWDISSSAFMPHDITQEGRSEVGVPHCTPGRGVGMGVFLLPPTQKELEGISPAAPWAERSWDQDALVAG